MLKLVGLTYATLFIILITSDSCRAQVNGSNSLEISLVEQELLATTLSANTGDNVHCGLQDKAGNLWFGTTADGVYKYDGKEFTRFTATNGLKTTIWSMLEDRSGELWIGTAEGVYRREGKRFIRIQVPQAKGNYDVWSIMQDSEGNLWFATGIGVYVYDGKSFTRFSVGVASASDCKYNVETILEDNAGDFWFGGRCNPGVYRFDGVNFTHLQPNGDDWAWPVLQDKEGNIWFSSWNGAYRYDGASFKMFTKKDGLSGNMIARIVEDRKGNLWFGGDGLSRYDGETFTHFSSNDGLTISAVWTILEDNASDFWIGTRESGLYRYDGVRFTKFSE